MSITKARYFLGQYSRNSQKQDNTTCS